LIIFRRVLRTSCPRR